MGFIETKEKKAAKETGKKDPAQAKPTADVGEGIDEGHEPSEPEQDIQGSN